MTKEDAIKSLLQIDCPENIRDVAESVLIQIAMQESCTDCVSREEVLGILHNVINASTESYYKGYESISDAYREIKALPSVQPKAEWRRKGKWIIKTVNRLGLADGTTWYEPVYECSVCGRVEESYLRFDEPIMPEDADFPEFCPHCGAEMEE